jgi:hypothetical protein
MKLKFYAQYTFSSNIIFEAIKKDGEEDVTIIKLHLQVLN